MGIDSSSALAKQPTHNAFGCRLLVSTTDPALFDLCLLSHTRLSPPPLASRCDDGSESRR